MEFRKLRILLTVSALVHTSVLVLKGFAEVILYFIFFTFMFSLPSLVVSGGAVPLLTTLHDDVIRLRQFFILIILFHFLSVDLLPGLLNPLFQLFNLSFLLRLSLGLRFCFCLRFRLCPRLRLRLRFCPLSRLLSHFLPLPSPLLFGLLLCGLLLCGFLLGGLLLQGSLLFDLGLGLLLLGLLLPGLVERVKIRCR